MLLECIEDEKCCESTFLYEIETPGNFCDWTRDIPWGVGGKEAADAPSTSEAKPQRVCDITAMFITKKNVYLVVQENGISVTIREKMNKD